EMDVRLAVAANGNPSAADLASQATLYQNVLSACMANSNCTSFLTWGVTDLHSWIPSSFPGFGSGLLFDQQYNPKPAYTSLLSALRSAGAAARPVINPDGIVIHAGVSTPVSPGCAASIYGTNLLSARPCGAAGC